MGKFLVFCFAVWFLFDLFVISPFGAMVRDENPYGKCLNDGYQRCYNQTTQDYIVDYSKFGEDKQCRPARIKKQNSWDENIIAGRRICDDIVVTLPYRTPNEQCMKTERTACRSHYWEK